MEVSHLPLSQFKEIIKSRYVYNFVDEFIYVLLQRLPPRGHKPILPKRQRTPFREARLVLVGGEQGAYAFVYFSWTNCYILSALFDIIKVSLKQNRGGLCATFSC
ncbi:hypothetical protein ABE29_09215 [Cytobacillus firmus]|nr:hypothetical protein [Cytobacillus firmus]MBG9552384.1 hypothetical protein [Cytobacillus firmus]MBG9555953.1 hypothetical protein [Cytobacillus firmus]MBG9574917.1 hypothetical protein [Cytobacillus firmus]SUV09238.1 Uncharacterised protein [Cytobacillus firmus]